MRALSVLQPWAWLIVNGHKDLENRTWPTRFRGEFLVHAGKKWGREQRDDLEFVREAFPQIVLPDSYELGGIVGAATLRACVMTHKSAWFNGPYGFVLANCKALPFVPYRGQLGFFHIPKGEALANA